MWFKYGLKVQKLQKQHALKGQKLLAQGNALGIRMNIKVRPERAKALDVGSFCPFRAFSLLDS